MKIPSYFYCYSCFVVGLELVLEDVDLTDAAAGESKGDAAAVKV